MKIEGHNINMFSSWQKKAVYKREESINLKTIKVKQPTNNNLDNLNISSQAKNLLDDDYKTAKSENISKINEVKLQLSEEDKQKILLLEAFLSKLKGEKVKIKIPVLFKDKPKKLKRKISTLSWQINYKLRETYREKEKISFSSTGIVKTSDGKELEFKLKVKMSREFATSKNIDLSISNGEPVDPIVINYANQSAAFKEETFEFDLDSNGTLEKIPYLNEGSGFLVLADDGSELKNGSQLFGPETGDGFSEMKEYDEDGNGWLDSGDSIFDELKIWTKDETGKDKLFALTDKNIGAIYLGNINANYNYKDMNNEAKAVNKKMGLYLGENGKAGTVQELDFIV